MVQNPHTSATKFETVRHNHINSWNFYKFCDTLKNGQTHDFQLRFFHMVGAHEWWDFTVVTKPDKRFYTFVWILNCFKVHNLVSDHPKRIKRGQMTTLSMILHAMVPVYRLVKIWSLPQFMHNFRMAYQSSLCIFLQVHKVLLQNCNSKENSKWSGHLVSSDKLSSASYACLTRFNTFFKSLDLFTVSPYLKSYVSLLVSFENYFDATSRQYLLVNYFSFFSSQTG